MTRLLIALVSSIFLATTLNPHAMGIGEDFQIESIDLPRTQVEGNRGAALALLSDGTVLLGGGNRGNTIFLYSGGELRSAGKVLQQSERFRDSRFAPTDIGILNESATSAELLISYPQLSQNRSCVRLVLFRYTLNTENFSLEKNERWFAGKPCVPVSAVQHAAGRIEIIDSKSAYLTTGDLGFPKINEVKSRGLLGGVFKVTAKSVNQISRGHRNPQGIVLVGRDLYISEHGPRGGDELNLIKQGQDYGWPFVTLGQPYSSGDYVKPSQTATHEGFEKPLYSWVPSVAPTELIKLPESDLWGAHQGALVMGTLAREALIFIQLQSRSRVGSVQTFDVNERVRDLDLTADGKIIATTDSGKILLISAR